MLITSGVLTIGSYTGYYPQEYPDPMTGKPIGFDMDLINAISQRMRLKPYMVKDKFQLLVNDLQAKRFDVVISAVSITPELQKQVDFIPYFRGGKSLLVPYGNPLHIHAMSDLCGHSVAVKKNSFEQEELQRISSLCTLNQEKALYVTVFSRYKDIVPMMQQKHVDAVYADVPALDYIIKLHPLLFALGMPVIGATAEGIVVPKGDGTLFSALQRALQAVQRDGTYRALIAHWGLYQGDITAPANDTSGS
ncbi:hypothetical protein KDI_02550 [Dictyobacter arantiisoli]|uniref:Solute-binding protein family 3/N-terminal domain-containing protein n=2 Tax=Dictyobacter arantiisoli TaxID=2014874 RepID=A0A5A5T5J5_9CHLR|nr:hypothetical protein KDI_02550 [Dictyobacter arantiisoli]